MRSVSVVLGFLAVLSVRGQERVAVMERVAEAPPCAVHRVSAGGVRLEIRGIFIGEGLLWVSLRAENRSAIDFRAGAMQFVIRDRRAFRRRARQEMRLVPVVRSGVAVVPADSAVVFCYGMVPRAPGKRQELVVEWMERNGDRRLQLRIRGRLILKARRI